jgi:LPXTG-motif cell wall-anchored protein
MFFWAVPVLAASGVITAVSGGVLIKRRKKKR